jgi:hypothetical protein
VREVYARLGSAEFGWLDVLRICRSEPELAGLNAGIERNEGYQKSLREDAILHRGEAS